MCGIFGVQGHGEASNLTYLGLYSMQHRGQESAGIASTDGEQIYRIRKPKLVSDAFSQHSFQILKGRSSIGHVRYSTTGDGGMSNVQPFSVETDIGKISIVHNGNLTNYAEIKKELIQSGAILQATTDTEVILHLIARSNKATLLERIYECFEKIQGAYSLLFLTPQELIATRDPLGIRPLCMGQLKTGQYVFSSETCAFDLIGAKYIRDVEPGEVVIVDKDNNLSSSTFSKNKKRASCIFEHIYFSRPDSKVFSSSAYIVRKNLGRQLAKEHPLKADYVISVPDSGNYAALGYSEQSGIPFEFGFIRNHYVGRTFIEPKQSIRGFGVKVKLNPVSMILEGKDLIVVDDSIVRGTTSKKIVKMLKDAGAGKVHMMISSPPFKSPCYYGIDTPNKAELLASHMSLEEIKDFIGADSVSYLSEEGMYSSLQQGQKNNFCDACFTANYPVKPSQV
ncbi:MAG: amidophosphoribosyltransferase [Bdellovibrionales bacterium]|nr:amidophosphoribosyltransferase [Bdellovibrionales bacterium]